MKTLTCREDAEEMLKNDTELKEWVSETMRFYYGMDINIDDIKHIIHCLKSLISELFDICPCGGFIPSVLMNDLTEATGRADSINSKYLRVYCVFMYNFVNYEFLLKYRDVHNKSKQKAKKDVLYLLKMYVLKDYGGEQDFWDIRDEYPYLIEYFNISLDDF